MKTTLLIALLASASGVLAAQTPPPQPLAPAGDAARGKVAFMAAGCYTCHGTVGHGGAGARLAPKPRPAAAFMAYVRSGRRGWSVAGGMPAYPVSVLPDAALTDIYAYLLSIPPPQPAAEIPLLKD
jgi:ubiquinol-cytochrome c reductase cytochrome c subunit